MKRNPIELQSLNDHSWRNGTHCIRHPVPTADAKLSLFSTSIEWKLLQTASQRLRAHGERGIPDQLDRRPCSTVARYDSEIFMEKRRVKGFAQLFLHFLAIFLVRLSHDLDGVNNTVPYTVSILLCNDAGG